MSITKDIFNALPKSKKLEYLFEQISEFSKLTSDIKDIKKQLENTRLIHDNEEFMKQFNYLDRILYQILEVMGANGSLPKGLKKPNSEIEDIIEVEPEDDSS